MIFIWNGEVIEGNENILNLHTTYGYRDILTDEILWETELDETVEKTTRQYVDMPGRFMFPSNLEKKIIRYMVELVWDYPL